MAKKFISAVHKPIKMTSFVQKLTVSSGKIIFLDLYVTEINFLVMDKISCPGQKVFCLGQYFFVLDAARFTSIIIFVDLLRQDVTQVERDAYQKKV